MLQWAGSRKVLVAATRHHRRMEGGRAFMPFQIVLGANLGIGIWMFSCPLRHHDSVVGCETIHVRVLVDFNP